METKTMTNKESNLIKGLIEQHSHTTKEAIELVDNHYIGQYNSLDDYAKEWLTELDEEHKNESWYFVSNNTDYEGLGENLEKDGHIKSVYLADDEKVYIFDVA